MSLLNKYPQFKPEGSPGTRLFITPEYKCDKCGSRKQANVIQIICTDKKQIFAIIQWRCHHHCEENLKLKEYQLLAPATIDKLKRKVPIEVGEAISLGKVAVQMEEGVIKDLQTLPIAITEKPTITEKIEEEIDKTMTIEKAREELYKDVPIEEEDEEDTEES